MAKLQVVDNEGAGVFVVGPDREAFTVGVAGAAKIIWQPDIPRRFLPRSLEQDGVAVLEPLETNGQVALHDLAGHGRSHALRQDFVREQEGHDAGRN